jgi:hypothetical protein
MDAGSILLGLALLVVVAAYVLRPLTGAGASLVAVRSDQKSRQNNIDEPHEQLLMQRDTIYAAIRELDFDYRLGKVSDEDYHPQRERLALQGVAVLKQLDALAPNGAARIEDDIEAEIVRRRKHGRVSARAAEVALSDAEIEAQIRALRRRPEAGAFCSRCGAASQADDRFCRNCGAALGSQGAPLSATGV